jgi:hypothetical protein
MAKRTELVQLALHESEKAELQKMAASLGLPVSVWIRSLALTAARIKGAA